MTTGKVEVGEVHIAYQTVGEGDTIVWVPGTGLSGMVFHRAQIPAVKDRYRCISCDLRGAGSSDAPPGPYSVPEMAGDVAGLCDALGVGRAHFVGHSLGSAICQELALARPGLVASLTLLSTWSSSADAPHISAWFEARLATLQGAPREVFGGYGFWMWSPAFVNAHPDQVAEHAQFFASISGTQPPAAYIAHFQADLAHETTGRLGQIACPTLVVHGAEDLITLPAYNRLVAERIPGARLCEIPCSGHMALLESPAAVNEAIEGLLASQSKL